MKSFFKHNLFASIGVVLCCLALVFILFLFRLAVNNQYESTMQDYLNDNVNALSNVFYTKLNDRLIMLESQTRYFKDIDLTDYNLMKSTIMSTKGIGAFKTIGVANSSGATINYNGKSSGNILLSDYYKAAMSGKNAISETTVTDEDGEKVLALAVPIMRNGKAVGVIYGTFTQRVLNSIADTGNFAKQGTNLLVTKNGTVIARTSDTEIIPENTDNFFEMFPEAVKPEKGKNSYFTIKTNNKEIIVVMTEIGTHGWFYATVLPREVLSKQVNIMSRFLLLTIAGMVFVFLLLLLLTVYLMRNNDKALKSNERFKLANAQEQNVVFDYDYERQTLTMEGNSEVITKEIKSEYTRDDVLKFLELVHEDDSNICREFLSVAEDDNTSVSGELRILCVDGHYYWFRLKSMVVRNEEGKPTHIIGNLTNADEQMNKELSLIKQAEIDSLTGIFNKGAFKTHVTGLIEENVDGFGAFYIIDLDNFKNVNDTLGHDMGDRVLAEAAKKIDDIFGKIGVTGRIGGDEFAAYISSENSEKSSFREMAIAKAALLCGRLEEVYSGPNGSVSVSASIGVAFMPDHGKEYDKLYKNGDKALYKIKRNGKDQFGVYSPEE